MRNSLSVTKHEHLSSYKASSNPHLSFSLQCRNWRHKKERFIPVRSAGKEEAQKEDRTAGRRHHGGHGSVLFPAGTGEGAGESITSGACCPMQATCRYIQISVSSFFFFSLALLLIRMNWLNITGRLNPKIKDRYMLNSGNIECREVCLFVNKMEKVSVPYHYAEGSVYFHKDRG